MKLGWAASFGADLRWPSSLSSFWGFRGESDRINSDAWMDGPDIYIIDPANKHASGLPRSIIHDPFFDDELELD